MRYNIGSWVKEARLKANLSQEKLAFALDVGGKGTVSAWEKNKNAPSFEIMIKISDLCAYPLPYIEPKQLSNEETKVKEGFIQLKLLDVKAAAGTGVINSEYPESINLISVSESWARKNIGNNLNSISIITVIGDSMSPTFEDGDLLFVDEKVNYYASEGIYVVSSFSGLKVKRLELSINGELRVISDNKNYPIDIFKDEEINSLNICGKVVATLRIKNI